MKFMKSLGTHDVIIELDELPKYNSVKDKRSQADSHSFFKNQGVFQFPNSNEYVGRFCGIVVKNVQFEGVSSLSESWTVAKLFTKTSNVKFGERSKGFNKSVNHEIQGYFTHISDVLLFVTVARCKNKSSTTQRLEELLERSTWDEM